MPTPKKFTSNQATAKIEIIRLMVQRKHRTTAQQVCDTLHVSIHTAYEYLAYMTSLGLLRRLEDVPAWVLGPTGRWSNEGQPIRLRSDYYVDEAHRRRDPMVAALFGDTGVAQP